MCFSDFNYNVKNVKDGKDVTSVLLESRETSTTNNERRSFGFCLRHFEPVQLNVTFQIE